MFSGLGSFPAQFIPDPFDEKDRVFPTKRDVCGRIHREEFRAFWRDELKASPHIMHTLEHGYRIPFAVSPPDSVLPNNATARDPANATFLDDEIRKL